MAVIAVSGQPGCRFEEVARICALRSGFELVTGSRVDHLIDQEYGAEKVFPDRAWSDLVTTILVHVARRHHLVLCCEGAEIIAARFPVRLRAYLVGTDAVRVGSVMLEQRLEREAARVELQARESAQKAERKRRFGKTTTPATLFDLIFNQESLDPEQIAAQIESSAKALGLEQAGLLSQEAAAQIEFRTRLRLSRLGIAAPGKLHLPERPFAHPSEQIFANLLDFYRVAWEYEPRSFPLQRDSDGKVVEAFTPDFYLPEFDLYVELTTMKQSLVTRKNRKVRMLRQLYPNINIQVFYQKDFENLIFKYGINERPVNV